MNPIQLLVGTNLTLTNVAAENTADFPNTIPIFRRTLVVHIIQTKKTVCTLGDLEKEKNDQQRLSWFEQYKIISSQ